MESQLIDGVIKYVESGRELTPLLIMLVIVLLYKIIKGLITNKINIFSNFSNLKEIKLENDKLELYVNTLNREIKDYDEVVNLLLEQLKLYEQDISLLTEISESAKNSIIIFQAMVDTLMDYGNLGDKEKDLLKGLSVKLKETTNNLSTNSDDVKKQAIESKQLVKEIIQKVRKIGKEDEQ